jgi:NB-ARC domain/TIR domain/APAF-1 helical domain
VPSTAAVQACIWVSYSRKDAQEYASELRRWLLREDLSVWQDLTLEGGRDWRSQIEDTLKSKAPQHLVLVVTRAMLASPVVRLETRLARQEGKTVCPVKGPGLRDLGELPRWLGQIYDLDQTEHRTTLIRVLRNESVQKRVPMMVPELSQDFVQRPMEFDALKSRLLNPRGDAVAAIGAGGYGKTMLAKALARDPDIQDAYFDGILWAEVGAKTDGLLPTLSDLITLLTGERSTLETVNAAATKLGEALGERRILIIVDDVWRAQDLNPFLEGGPNCVRLVTTRIDSVLPSTALRQPVDAMRTSEAIELLSTGLPEKRVASERANLAKLAARLGEWALLLKIVNGFLRDRVVSASQPLSVAIADANKRLDAKGLVAFDARGASDRTKAVGRAIGVSLELPSESERTRLCELSVFPDGVDIPIGVVARLWAATADLEDFKTEDLLSRLYDVSLLLDLDFGQSFFRLHDTIRNFLRDRAGADGLTAWHRQLVASLDRAASADADTRTRRYYYLYLPHHLAEARERDRLDALLLDPGWLKAKLEATANPQALVADYQRYGVGEAQGLIGRTLRLISGICTRDPRQLPQQLIGRLAGFKAIAESGSSIGRAGSFPIRPSFPLGPRSPRLGPRLLASRGTPALSTLCTGWRTGGSRRVPGTGRSGCGTSRPGPRPVASRGTPALSTPSAGLGTGGLSRALPTGRSGCGTQQLDGHRPPVGARRPCLSLLPARGRAARLGLCRRDDPAMGRGG